MFEYHGWITVRNSPGDDDDGEGVLQDSVRASIDGRLMELEEATLSTHLVILPLWRRAPTACCTFGMTKTRTAIETNSRYL
ncbi:MAG: hypothetical protein J2P17_28625 [Mycobacterium sp.]|nr:hypothetical protein [Mycobacterium sp.]